MLRGYPVEVRRRNGPDMMECFRDLCMAAHLRAGPLGVIGVVVRTAMEAPSSAWGARRRVAREGGGTMMGGLLQDVRYGIRGLARTPGFTLLAVVSLGLGVGANTTMFTLVKAVVWSELPVDRPDRLTRVFEVRDGYSDLSFANLEDVRDQADVFSGMFTQRLENFGMVAGETSRLVTGELVSGTYFDVLGVDAALGRTLAAAIDDLPGAPLAAVISHHLWTTDFDSDPGVLGRTLDLNRHRATVIGVAPASFHGTKFALGMDLWVPIRAWAAQDGWAEGWEDARGNTSYPVVARLADGVDLDGANAALAALSSRLAGAHPDANTGMTLRAVPERAGAVNPAAASLPDLIGLVAVLASGLVLLVACGNVASLLLARAVARRKEMGVRVALGAGRRRLLRQLLTEGVLLAALGAAAGVLTARVASRFDGLLLPDIPYRFDLPLAPDPLSVAWAAAASLLAVLVFGLAPALHAVRPGVADVLRDGARSGEGGAAGRLLDVVVIGMVTLSFVTLFLAGTFAQSLDHVKEIDPGIAREGRVMATVDLALAGTPADRAPAVFEAMVREMETVPGVAGVALTSSVPLGDFRSSSRVYAGDREYRADELGPVTWLASVSPDYFETGGVVRVAGRGLEASDGAGDPRVAVINQALAETWWPGQDAVGRRVRFTPDADAPEWEVVGVVETGRYLSLTEPPMPALYRPFAQAPRTTAVLVSRVTDDPARVVPALREAARRVEPAAPLFDVVTSGQLLANAQWLYRIGAGLALAIGLLAAALAAGGLYGIMAFRVGRRRREMGIRIALGAGDGAVMGHVLSGGARLLAVGVVLGGGATLLAAGTLEALVYGVEVRSVARLLPVALVLTAVALLATMLPAWTATRADPVRALRTE